MQICTFEDSLPDVISYLVAVPCICPEDGPRGKHCRGKEREAHHMLLALFLLLPPSLVPPSPLAPFPRLFFSLAVSHSLCGCAVGRRTGGGGGGGGGFRGIKSRQLSLIASQKQEMFGLGEGGRLFTH